MLQNAYGLIELILVFGAVLAFLGWELVKTRRGVKADRERAERERKEP